MPSPKPFGVYRQILDLSEEGVVSSSRFHLHFTDEGTELRNRKCPISESEGVQNTRARIQTQDFHWLPIRSFYTLDTRNW